MVALGLFALAIMSGHSSRKGTWIWGRFQHQVLRRPAFRMGALNVIPFELVPSSTNGLRKDWRESNPKARILAGQCPAWGRPTYPAQASTAALALDCPVSKSRSVLLEWK